MSQKWLAFEIKRFGGVSLSASGVHEISSASFDGDGDGDGDGGIVSLCNSTPTGSIGVSAISSIVKTCLFEYKEGMCIFAGGTKP